MPVLTLRNSDQRIADPWDNAGDVLADVAGATAEIEPGDAEVLVTSVPSPKSLGPRCVQNGPPARRSEPDWR